MSRRVLYAGMVAVARLELAEAERAMDAAGAALVVASEAADAARARVIEWADVLEQSARAWMAAGPERRAGLPPAESVRRPATAEEWAE